MSTNNPPKIELHAEIFSYPETLVAECVEVPVIVEAKTLDELQAKMAKGINGYFQAFEEYNKRKHMMKIPLTT